MARPPKADRLEFDGIICVGGSDWWYHNRGHFDFQIMRRLAAEWPVLYVNSLGVRMPSVSNPRSFCEKIARKAKSLWRGITHVERKFWVTSPLLIPGVAGQRLSGFALAPQIRLAARRIGITRPLLWVHCPAGAPLLHRLAPVATVMQRTDRFEAFPEGDSRVLSAQVAEIKKCADLVVYCAPHLMEEERDTVSRQLLVTHGVDLQKFTRAGDAAECPPDMAALPRPRIGFIGSLDAHTFDTDLFLATASRLPDTTFVMIGGSSLPEGWCQRPNVHCLGRKPYEDVARYMAAMDALIMPWNRSEWIKACNPVKLKEYLAVGRPVITTDFPALDGWRDLVTVAEDGDAFAAAIRAALLVPHDPSLARSRLALETWDHKAEMIATELSRLGLMFAGRAASQDRLAMGAAALVPGE